MTKEIEKTKCEALRYLKNKQTKRWKEKNQTNKKRNKRTKRQNKQTNKQTNKQCSAYGIGQRQRTQGGWTPSLLRSRELRCGSSKDQLLPKFCFWRRRLVRGMRLWLKGTLSAWRRTSRGSWRSRGRSSCWAGGSREPRLRSMATRLDEGRASRSTITRTQVLYPRTQ